MERRKEIKSFIIIGLGSVLSALLGVLTTFILTRLVDTEVFGSMSLFNTYGHISVMILSLGLDQGLIRYYYSNDNSHRSKLFKFVLFIPIIITLPLAGLFLLLVGLGVIRYDFGFMISVLLVVFIVVSLFNRFGIIQVRLEKRPYFYSLCNILNKIIYLLLAVLFILLTSFAALNSLIYATIAATFIATVICFVNVRILRVRTDRSVKLEPGKKELFKFSLPFIISLGITTLFEATDKLCLNYMSSKGELGIYASALTIIGMFTVVQTAFNAVWAPMAIENYTNDEKDTSLYVKANGIISVIMFIFGILVIAFKDLIGFFLGAKYRAAVYFLPLLTLHPIMYTISETTVVGVDFKKKSYFHTVIALIACACNIAGNILLIPYLGGKGAAISTGLSYVIFFVMRSIFGNKFFKVDADYIRFVFVTAVYLLYAFYNMFYKFGYLAIILSVAITLLVCFLYRTELAEIFMYFVGGVKRKKVGVRPKRVLHVFTGMNYVYTSALIKMFNEKVDNTENSFLVCDLKDNIPLELLETGKVSYLTKNGYRASLNAIIKASKTADWIVYHFLPNNPLLHLYYWIHPIKTRKIMWRIWGADLYNWKYKGKNKIVGLFVNYLRKYVRQTISYVIPYEMDMDAFRNQFPKSRAIFLDGPDPMGYDCDRIDANRTVKPDDRTWALVGHSAVRHMNHEVSLVGLKENSNGNLNVILPLNYGDKAYGAEVMDSAIQKFGEKNVYAVTEKLNLDEYMQLLWKCDVAVFHSERQIAMGNITMLMYMQKKIFLPRDSVMYDYYTRNGLCIYDSNDLSGVFSAQNMTEEQVAANRNYAIEQLDIDIIANKWRELFDRFGASAYKGKKNEEPDAPEDKEAITDNTITINEGDTNDPV